MKRQISLRIDKFLLEKAQKLARQKNCTLTEIFEISLHNYCFWELKGIKKGEMNGMDKASLQKVVDGKHEMGTE